MTETKKIDKPKNINYVLYDVFEEKNVVVDAFMHLKNVNAFYTDILLYLEKELNTDVPVACVTINAKKRISLRINPNYFVDGIRSYIRHENKYEPISYIRDKYIDNVLLLNKEITFNDISEKHVTDADKIALKFNAVEPIALKFRLAIIQHELLHLIFNHLPKMSEFPNKKMSNVAMDLVVNQHINRDYLSKGCCFIDSFPELKLEAFESTNYYYDKLNDLKNEVDKEQSKSGEGDEGDEEGSGEGESSDGQSSGQGKASQSTSWKNLEKYLAEDDNHNWEDYEKMSSEEKKQFEKQLREIIKNAYQKSKLCGKLPSNLVGYLDDFCLSDQVISWKSMLRLFVQNACDINKKTSINRRSRRTSLVPGSRTKKKTKLLVAIDTSGSVSDAELAKFMSEIYYLYRTKNVEIDICQCDTEVKDYGNGKSVYTYKGKLDFEIVGRGGTDFNPPIELFNKSKEYAGLIYFTDGYCEPPSVKIKSNAKLLWVVTNDNTLDDNYEGKKIHLPID